ncbi:MAG: bZIP transcription factor [Alphaproteobacteria bacterium]|nr:bZIP transcription factor [Alphaproteobacteria bacterium]
MTTEALHRESGASHMQVGADGTASVTLVSQAANAGLLSTTLQEELVPEAMKDYRRAWDQYVRFAHKFREGRRGGVTKLLVFPNQQVVWQSLQRGWLGTYKICEHSIDLRDGFKVQTRGISRGFNSSLKQAFNRMALFEQEACKQGFHILIHPLELDRVSSSHFSEAGQRLGILSNTSLKLTTFFMKQTFGSDALTVISLDPELPTGAIAEYIQKIKELEKTLKELEERNGHLSRELVRYQNAYTKAVESRGPLLELGSDDQPDPSCETGVFIVLPDDPKPTNP